MGPKTKQVLFFLTACLEYAVGYYHRNVVGVLKTPLSKALDVTVPQIGILGTMFFWSYAVIQPFIGPLADSVRISRLIAFASIIAAIGMAICGFSRNFYLTCFARLLVGASTGAIYVPISRATAQWFSPLSYTYAQAVLVCAGGAGGILGQKPVALFTGDHQWYWVFYIGAIASFLLTFMSLFFLKSSPEGESPKSKPIKDLLIELGHNYKEAFKTKELWIVAIYKFMIPACYTNISSNWGQNYLTDGLDYDTSTASTILSLTSIANAVCSPIITFISNKVKSRKMTMIASNIIGLSMCVFFMFVNKKPNVYLFSVAFFIFSTTTGAVLVLAGIILKEIKDKELFGTLLGCGNFFLFFGTSIQQLVTSEICQKYQPTKGEPIPLDAFKKGLWLLDIFYVILGCIPCFFITDTYEKAIGATSEPLLSKEEKK